MKTRKNYLMVIIAFTALFAFASCNDKNSDVEVELEPETVNLVNESAVTETVEDEIDISVNEAIAYSEQQGGNMKLASTGPECGTLTVTPNDGSFPKTITLDFGEGCEGVTGRVRSGSITVVITDTLRKTGASYTVSFDNFAVEHYAVNGSKSVENIGTEDLPSFSEETNITVTTASGIEIEKTKTSTREWIEGTDTYTVIDDVFLISGSADVMSSTGRSYSYIITEPLKVARICENILEGVMEITWTGQDEPVTIDFGEGICDLKIYVSRANRIRRRVMYLNNL